MPVSNLHEAAVVVRGAHQAIEKLLAETVPRMRRVYEEIGAVEVIDGKAPQGVFDAINEKHGWSAFYDAVADLRDLLETPGFGLILPPDVPAAPRLRCVASLP